jgi:DNA-directed RNA polymerase alpha subunit
MKFADWPPQGTFPERLLDSPVTELELPVSLMNTLNNMNIQSIRDLLAQPEKALLKALGTGRLRQIQERFQELGTRSP